MVSDESSTTILATHHSPQPSHHHNSQHSHHNNPQTILATHPPLPQTTTQPPPWPMIRPNHPWQPTKAITLNPNRAKSQIGKPIDSKGKKKLEVRTYRWVDDSGGGQEMVELTTTMEDYRGKKTLKWGWLWIAPVKWGAGDGWCLRWSWW